MNRYPVLEGEGLPCGQEAHDSVQGHEVADVHDVQLGGLWLYKGRSRPGRKGPASVVN